ncbi:MAG TPA: LysR family transcriptional regulator [Enterococcus sp.]|nr:LysR family transcriptional regulator [Enterococcus sp.]HPR80941.1 LysR family transcriptional regulator [Enterococcus sp.]
MNIQQMRYVAAIANNGSFREAAKKLYISQPSLSHAIKELEKELDVQLFERTRQGASLTSEGMDFFQYTQPILAQVELLENRYLANEENEKHFSISSQHYDFLSIMISQLIQDFPDYNDFRIFESTTLNVIKDVEQYRSEFGILLFNDSNQAGLSRLLENGELEYEILTTFQTHIFMREGHPLATKSVIELSDLHDYSQVRFTQETNNYTYFAEDLIDFPGITQVIHTSDRATLTGILQRTDAYGSGSGLVEDPRSQGIVLIPLANSPENKMVMIKKKSRRISGIGETFLTNLKKYFIDFQEIQKNKKK